MFSLWSESADAKAQRENAEPARVRVNRFLAEKLAGAIAAHAVLEKTRGAYIEARRHDALASAGLVELPRPILPTPIPLQTTNALQCRVADGAPICGAKAHEQAPTELAVLPKPNTSPPPTTAATAEVADSKAAPLFRPGDRVDAFWTSPNSSANTGWWTAVVMSAVRAVPAVAGTDGGVLYKVMYDDRDQLEDTKLVRAPAAGARVGTSQFATEAARVAFREFHKAELAFFAQYAEPMAHLLRQLLESLTAGGNMWLLGTNPSLTRRCVVLDVQYGFLKAVVTYKAVPLTTAPEHVIVNQDGSALLGTPEEVIDIGNNIKWTKVRALASPSQVLDDKSIDDVKAIRAIATATGAGHGVNVLL